MKKIAIVLVLLVSVFLMAACSNQAPQGPEPTINTTSTTVTPSVCGDGVCDNSEMCNIDTLTSGCQDDCGPCPSSLYVEALTCDGDGCEKTGTNEFTLKVPTAIKARIANLGEALANTMTSDFRCYANDQKVVQHMNLKNYKGVVFNDYFDVNGKQVDEAKLNAKGQDGSETIYKLDLNKWEQQPLEDFEVTCNFEIITHSPIKNDKQTFVLKFKQ